MWETLYTRGAYGFKSTNGLPAGKHSYLHPHIPINTHALLTLLPPSRIGLNGDNMEYANQTPTSPQLLLFHSVTPPPPAPLCKTWWSDPSLVCWIPPSPNELRSNVKKVHHHPNRRASPPVFLFL